MLNLRQAADRGHTNLGWLNSYHTFSFGEYLDPEHMGFRQLRVINEDRVAPGGGFGAHPHRDMEIISYVLEGQLAHKDSMGNGSTIKPGDVQVMSAGTGVTHSEFNHSQKEPAHFLQIWILPRQKGLKPGYQQKFFGKELKENKFCLIGSPDGKEGSIVIHQDVSLFNAVITKGQDLSYPFLKGRHGWLQVLKGALKVSDQKLEAGDGLAISDETKVNLSALASSEILLFDLA